METFSALLAICAGNTPVTGEFHAQRPVTRSFDVFFDSRIAEYEMANIQKTNFVDTLPRVTSACHEICNILDQWRMRVYFAFICLFPIFGHNWMYRVIKVSAEHELDYCVFDRDWL